MSFGAERAINIMSISDVAIISLLLLLIPKLVETYLAAYGFDRYLRMLIIIGGILWISASISSEMIYQVLGLVRGTDGNKYASLAYSSVLPALETQKYGQVLNTLLSTDIQFFVAYQAIIYYLTGGTVITLIATNCFLTFWGGLVLTRLVYSLIPPPHSGNRILPIILIFFPSVVFWSCSSLKEALMYWSICHVYAFVMPSKSFRENCWSFFLFIVACFVGAGIRGHLIFFWVVSVLVVKVFQRGFWKWGLILLFMLRR